MSVPEIVQSTLGDEQAAATVSLGGEDALYVTSTRTLIYRGDGLLSDESVEEYPHDAERIEVSKGRRKATIALDYGIDGVEEFSIPAKHLHDALHPVLAGVLNGAGVTDTNEQVIQTYQFSELTLVVTSARVVKHVGEAVWDEDFEQYHYGDVTGVDVEEGTVSSQIIIEVDGRPQRIKTPSDRTREVRERVERALLDYHDLDSYAEFEQTVAPQEEPDADAGGEADEDPFGSGVDPIDANPPELDDDGQIVEESATVDERDEAATTDAATTDAATSASAPGNETAAADAGRTDDAGTDDSFVADSTDSVTTTDPDPGQSASETDQSATAETGTGESTGFADSGFEPAGASMDDGVEQRLDALTETVERQNELLEKQQRTIERLVEELSRAR
ncbi:DUF7115 domain-containing protein [Halomicrococcus gelatinilyticus]|uniref:DUF7115 domain-containing protein n=1 Tax=Halomicrococcus gelatinilyticus TaxID=1702103 RepID=UPI002E0D5017